MKTHDFTATMQFGIVSAIDAAAHSLRVKIPVLDDMVTDWLPMATPAATARCWPSPTRRASGFSPPSRKLGRMKHAGPAALDQLETILARLRDTPGLIEKKRGVFYVKSRAFLHFHEDPSGLYADIRNAAGDFDRVKLEGQDGEDELVALAVARSRP